MSTNFILIYKPTRFKHFWLWPLKLAKKIRFNLTKDNAWSKKIEDSQILYAIQNLLSEEFNNWLCLLHIHFHNFNWAYFIVPLTSCRWKVGKRLKNTTKTNTIKKGPTEWREISPLAVFRDQNIVNTFFWHWSNDVYGSVEPVFHRPRHVYSYKSRDMTWQNAP